MIFPTVTSTENLSTFGSDSAPSNEKSAAVNTTGPSANASGICTMCVILVTMFESSSHNMSTLLAEARSNKKLWWGGSQAVGKSLPGPRYLELRSAPTDVLAMAAFGARPNDMATSWTD